MYRRYYGLKYKPFELAPVGGRVYLSEGHREALATLRYGVVANKGNFILQLANFLKEYSEQGGKVLLIIDEAQAFPTNLLEEIRLLSNHAGQRNALSIFLIGQTELQDKYADPMLLPLRQGIGLRHHLEPLSESDTAQYIAYRLNKADAASSALFDNSAVSVIHKESRGNPRLINIICDHALLTGFTRDLRIISKDVIDECIKEIKLKNEKNLQGSDNQKKPKMVLNFFGKQLVFSKRTRFALLATFIVIISLIILYNFAPGSWWQYFFSLSTPIIEIIK